MPKKVGPDYTGTFQRGNIWWYHVPENGKTKYCSSHSTDRDECLRQRDEKLKAMRNGSDDPAVIQRITIAELLDDYLAYLKREGKASYCTKCYHAAHLKRFMGKLRGFQLGTSKSVAYRDWRKGQTSHLKTPIEDSTINRELETLIAAFYYGKDKQSPPTVKTIPRLVIVKSAEDAGRRTGTLSKEMYPFVRDAIKDEGVRAMFVVSYEVGIRAGELMKMKWDMVDLKRGYLFLPWKITKNNKSGALPIWDDGDMKPALQYMKTAQEAWNPNCPYVFRWCGGRMQGKRIKSYREQWEAARETVGLPELLFHDLRRSTVTNMAIDGFVREHRQLISRHADERMEAQYNQSYLETLDLMKQQRTENHAKLQAIAAPAPERPMELPASISKYERLSPAQRAIIDGMIEQMPVAS